MIGGINQIKNVGEEKTEHPCQIPLKLIKNIILTTANKNDLIIDVFAGSGTTGLAAQQLGYDYIMYEINKEYCEIINRRLAQKTLFV